MFVLLEKRGESRNGWCVAPAALAETSPVSVAFAPPAGHGEADQAGGPLLFEGLCDLSYFTGEECVHLDAQRFKLMLPMPGNGAAEQNRHVFRQQLATFVANGCLPELLCVRRAVRFVGIEQNECFRRFEQRCDAMSAKRNGDFHDGFGWDGMLPFATPVPHMICLVTTR